MGHTQTHKCLISVCQFAFTCLYFISAIPVKAKHATGFSTPCFFPKISKTRHKADCKTPLTRRDSHKEVLRQCLPLFVLEFVWVGAARRAARTRMHLYLLYSSPSPHPPMSTRDAGMHRPSSLTRRHTRITAASRAEASPMSYYGRSLYSVSWSCVGACVGLITRVLCIGLGPPSFPLPLAPYSPTHDASRWRPWQSSRSVTRAGADVADADATQSRDTA